MTASIWANRTVDTDTDSVFVSGNWANAACVNSRTANEIRKVDKRIVIDKYLVNLENPVILFLTRLVVRQDYKIFKMTRLRSYFAGFN
jgi:hypothetical protein